jgi:hypothetical protein
MEMGYEQKLHGKDMTVGECPRLIIRSSHAATSFILPT